MGQRPDPLTEKVLVFADPDGRLPRFPSAQFASCAGCHVLKEQVQADPNALDLLGVKLAIRIVAPIVVDKQTQAPGFARPEQFKASFDIRINEPVKLLKRFKIRPEYRGRDQPACERLP